MKATLLLRERQYLEEDVFIETVVWRVPSSVSGSSHVYKYSPAYVVGGVCRVRYDNEAGKGDHKHIDDRESAYRFTSVEALMSDFLRDVQDLRS